MRRLFNIMTTVLIQWILTQSVALAQERSFELSGSVGYTWNEGVKVRDFELPNDEGIITELKPQSGVSYGAGADYRLPYKNVMLGFHWSYVGTELNGAVRAQPERKLADLDMNNYHGTITWEFPSPYRSTIPFIRIGFGATQYSIGDIMGQSTDGDSRFSTTWTLGLKVYRGDALGIAIAGRWVPTYIKSDSGGYWCNGYGCWYTADADYQNQLDLGGSILLRL